MTDIWVYYPELDTIDQIWYTIHTWWWKKKVLLMKHELLSDLLVHLNIWKVWAVDEWWNTKVYYYQGNNNLRNTFVYNVVDLTGVESTRVYILME